MEKASGNSTQIKVFRGKFKSLHNFYENFNLFLSKKIFSQLSSQSAIPSDVQHVNIK